MTRRTPVARRVPLSLGPLALILVVLGGCGAGPSTKPTAPGLAPSAAPVAEASPIAALEAALPGSVGVATDTSGNLYVSQCASDASLISRIDRHGELTPFAGAGPIGFSGDDGPALAATIGCPVGMAIGPDGALYFADHANNRVRRIDQAGIITTIAGSGPAGVNQGSFSGDGGPATSATLQEPWDVAFDGKGNLFIADRDNHRVRRVDPGGVITTVAGDGTRRFAGDAGAAVSASLAAPLGIVVDTAGNLFIADSGNERVRMVSPDGVISTYAGTGVKDSSGDGGPATSAAIEEPHDVAFDSAGAMLVSTGGRIRRIDADGTISTMAGAAGVGLPVDGIAATKAHFGEVDGIAIDDAGNLFMADGYNSVYRIDPNGILTRFAGRRQ